MSDSLVCFRSCTNLCFTNIMSDDEFDQLPDPFAGIDWNTIPELSTILPAPQPSLSHSSGAPTLVEARPQASTPLANGCDSTPESTQYSFDEWDAAFLTEVNKAEQGLLQPQSTGGQFSRIDRAEGTSTHSNSGSALTSRYFHGESPPVCDHRDTSYTLTATESHAEQVISSPYSTRFYPSAKGFNEGVNSTNSHSEGSEGGPFPTSEPGVYSTNVVHRLSSPPTRESSPKRHKGKQKESPRAMLKEFLNSFEDEIVCPMSGSEQHPDNKHVLTFTILDAVIFCKTKYACIRGSKGHEYSSQCLCSPRQPMRSYFLRRVWVALDQEKCGSPETFCCCFLHMVEGGTFLCNLSGQSVRGCSDDT
jgi:hypothetical protein